VTLAPPDPQNCGYQWANQDLPELSSSFQHSCRRFNPKHWVMLIFLAKLHSL
jgi:hypothetical protein